MQGEISTHPPSDCRHDLGFTPEDNGLGGLFRDYGEAYIRSYKPGLVEIKLIRSIRVCKTPALGGTVYTCKGCKSKRYIYFSCGNSRCPKCQGIKRIQWQDKIASRLLKCPPISISSSPCHISSIPWPEIIPTKCTIASCVVHGSR